MTVSIITPPAGSNPHPRQPDAQARVVEQPSESRALVCVERPVRTFTVGAARPDAAFVAHLIAMAEQAPQTRNLRRVTSADAQVIYQRMAAQGKDTGNDNRRMLSKTA